MEERFKDGDVIRHKKINLTGVFRCYDSSVLFFYGVYNFQKNTFKEDCPINGKLKDFRLATQLEEIEMRMAVHSNCGMVWDSKNKVFYNPCKAGVVGSIKNDRKDNKPMWDLLPLQEVENIVDVYTAGAKKYGPNRWQNLENGYQRYKAAMFRHLLEYEKGNRIDPDTGCMHLAQVAWNAIAMLHLDKNGKGLLKEDNK